LLEELEIDGETAEQSPLSLERAADMEIESSFWLQSPRITSVWIS
jgi:hypothetical protein